MRWRLRARQARSPPSPRAESLQPQEPAPFLTARARLAAGDNGDTSSTHPSGLRPGVPSSRKALSTYGGWQRQTGGPCTLTPPPGPSGKLPAWGPRKPHPVAFKCALAGDVGPREAKTPHEAGRGHGYGTPTSPPAPFTTPAPHGATHPGPGGPGNIERTWLCVPACPASFSHPQWTLGPGGQCLEPSPALASPVPLGMCARVRLGAVSSSLAHEVDLQGPPGVTERQRVSQAQLAQEALMPHVQSPRSWALSRRAGRVAVWSAGGLVGGCTESGSSQPSSQSRRGHGRPWTAEAPRASASLVSGAALLQGHSRAPHWNQGLGGSCGEWSRAREPSLSWVPGNGPTCLCPLQEGICEGTERQRDPEPLSS